MSNQICLDLYFAHINKHSVPKIVCVHLKVFWLPEQNSCFEKKVRSGKGPNKKTTRQKGRVATDGQNQIHSKKVYRRQGAQKTTRYEGGTQICSGYGRTEKTASLQTRHCCTQRSAAVPKVDRVSDQKTAFPKTGSWVCAQLQGRAPFRKGSHELFATVYGDVGFHCVGWRAVLLHPREASDAAGQRRQPGYEDHFQTQSQLLTNVCTYKKMDFIAVVFLIKIVGVFLDTIFVWLISSSLSEKLVLLKYN